jgi:hypothetical protein
MTWYKINVYPLLPDKITHVDPIYIPKKSTCVALLLVKQSYCLLVVWNIFYFSIQLGTITIPTGFHSMIFQRGRSTTNQIINHH